MQTIRLTTWVDAPVERCFRLAATVDLTAVALGSRRARAVEGVRTGPMGKGDAVTWRGWHFGWQRRHESVIEELRPCSYFLSVMRRGSFALYEHEHHFAAMDGGTRIRDEVRFRVSGWMGGRIVEGMVGRRVAWLLRRRNAAIKEAAEGEGWRGYLGAM